MTNDEQLLRVRQALGVLRSLVYGCTGPRAEGQDPRLVHERKTAYESAIMLLENALSDPWR